MSNPELDTLDYIVAKTIELQHPISNLVLNKYLFVFNLINYVEAGQCLFNGEFVGLDYGPTDRSMYPVYNNRHKDRIDQLAPHVEMQTIAGLLSIKQVQPDINNIDTHIKDLVDTYLPNLLTYDFDALVAKLNQPPYRKYYGKLYHHKTYQTLAKYYRKTKRRFWEHVNNPKTKSNL